MRAPDDRPGSPRRLAGAMLAARRSGLVRLGDAAVTEPAGPAAPEFARVAAPSRVRAIVLAALGLSATGVLVGGLWAWMAPPIHLVVAITRSGERVHDYLGAESQHFFDVPCLMLGLLTVLAVVAPVLAWQWRRLRGPGMVIGLTIGMVGAAAVASALGAV